jgi:uncharacterized membrane protein YjgN (DUF898 family)
LAARFTGAAARFVVDFDAAFFARGFLATVFFAVALLAVFFVAAFFVAGFAAFATLRAGALAAIFFAAFTVAFFAAFFAVFLVADLRAWVAMRVSGRNDVIAPSAHVGAIPLDTTPDIQAG